MVGQRAAGVPLEQVVGWAEFCGLRITVAPGVFVPRRRTEFLVRQAVALARPGAVIVDLCCGAGAIGAALAAAVEGAEVHAADVDPAAVRCARQNLPAGRVYQGDLYEPLPATLRGRVAILTANVPYVPTGEIGYLPPEARAHEPRAALDGGADGLDVLRRVAAGAAGWLAPGGSPAERDQRAPGPAGRVGPGRRRPDRPGGELGGPGGHRRHRAPPGVRASAPAPVRLRVRRPGDGRPGAADRDPAGLGQDIGDELVGLGQFGGVAGAVGGLGPGAARASR